MIDTKGIYCYNKTKEVQKAGEHEYSEETNAGSGNFVL